MTLFDEVQKLSSESHAKWFERYFRERDLVTKIKISAQQGYTGYFINVMPGNDEYTKLRLRDEKTLIALKELLGPGFTVERLLNERSFLYDEKIHITW